jgi:sugar phosphate isomerase/epimerase
LNTGASAVYIVESVGVPNLGLNPDLANLYRSPNPQAETWIETLERCAPMMNYWHVKNFARVPLGDVDVAISFPTALGSGDINYRAALETVAAYGYGGPICIEHYGGDAVSAQRDGLRYMTELLDDMDSEREMGK